MAPIGKHACQSEKHEQTDIYHSTFAIITTYGCSGAKLSVANEQMERGEYYDAQRTYRKCTTNLQSAKNVHNEAK